MLLRSSSFTLQESECNILDEDIQSDHEIIKWARKNKLSTAEHRGLINGLLYAIKTQDLTLNDIKNYSNEDINEFIDDLKKKYNIPPAFKNRFKLAAKKLQTTQYINDNDIDNKKIHSKNAPSGLFCFN